MGGGAQRGCPAVGAPWLLWGGAVLGVGPWPGGPLFTSLAALVAWCLVTKMGVGGLLFPAWGL